MPLGYDVVSFFPMLMDQSDNISLKICFYIQQKY